MSTEKNKNLDTLAVHAGVTPDPTTGAIMTPIYATSTYVQSSPGKHSGYEYSRTSNPTRKALETSLAALEGGQFGFAFASGCAASDCVMHLLDAGDHMVCGDDVYGGTSRLLRTIWQRHGIEVTFADLTKVPLNDVMTAKTKLVWVESPTNPLFKIFDIQKIAEQASQHPGKPLLLVDNTFATPINQNPLVLGADIVLHSTTKYLNGHSDVVGGALITDKQDLADRIHQIQNSAGGVAGPFDAWLVLRGVKTLAVRMDRHALNGQKIAEFLESHAAVESVLYPGLASHPQHALAQKQMNGFGGMLTFFLKGGLNEARRFLEKLEIFALAESLGGVESLAEHPAIMTHASIPPETRKTLGISDNLVRLSVGIENVEDLMADLEQALK